MVEIVIEDHLLGDDEMLADVGLALDDAVVSVVFKPNRAIYLIRDELAALWHWIIPASQTHPDGCVTRGICA